VGVAVCGRWRGGGELSGAALAAGGVGAVGWGGIVGVASFVVTAAAVVRGVGAAELPIVAGVGLDGVGRRVVSRRRGGRERGGAAFAAGGFVAVGTSVAGGVGAVGWGGVAGGVGCRVGAVGAEFVTVVGGVGRSGGVARKQWPSRHGRRVVGVGSVVVGGSAAVGPAALRSLQAGSEPSVRVVS
jgi:hypothetical protein